MINSMPPPPKEDSRRIAWLEQLIFVLQQELNEKQRQIDDHETRIAALETP